MPEPENYYATYCRLEEASGDSCVVLNANAVIIAAELTVTKQVDGLLDDGWTCRAFASAVVIDKIRNTNWVEVAIVCYPSKDAPVFEPFVASIADRIAKGDHPAIALSSKELEHVIESGGQWADVKSQQLPKLEKGVAYFKTKRTMTENLAYAAAAGNKGCYVGLFVVLFVIIFLIVSFFIFR